MEIPDNFALEQNFDQAFDTPLPNHKRVVREATVFEIAGGDTTFEGLSRIVPVTDFCEGDYPRDIERIVDEKLVTSCTTCKAPFVWVRQTKTWSRT